MRLSDEQYEFIKGEVVALFERYDVRSIPISGFELAYKMGITFIPYSSLTEMKRLAAMKVSTDGFYTIISIDVVNDREAVSHSGVQKELLSTKGIIFHLADGNEISFEISTWFSEMITIRRGYELLKQFTPTADFCEEWEESEGYTSKCSREVISVK